ncbi:MAG: hypothetical protein ACPGWR_21790 [Ardenticatenaceae bacterium]
MSSNNDNLVPEVKIEQVEDAKEQTEPGGESLGQEIREFGRNLIGAFRSVAHSDELRHLGNEIVESLRDIGQDIQETFERTKEKEEVKTVSEQAKRMTESVSANIRSGEMGNELQSGLTNALRTLNTELNKIIDQIQAKSARVEADVEGSAKAKEEPVKES